MICLDTNVAIAVIELRFGIAASVRRHENARRLKAFLRFPLKILPFEPPDAEHAADIRAGLKRQGKPIGAYDVLIAAQARRHGATLVTANTRELARVPRLTIEDWTA